jgi:phage terminase small subunit
MIFPRLQNGAIEVSFVARPRTPSNVLELRGAFRKHPERRRKDAPGAGVLNHEPPEELGGAAARAWRFLVERLPQAALSSSDEVAIAQAARLMAAIWALDSLGGALNRQYASLSAELRQWLIQLGMTPQARTKLPVRDPDKPRNRFKDV